jgi:hypothetical protein
MTEPDYDRFVWIRTFGDERAYVMRLHFGASPDDQMPFILTVTPEYVARTTQKTMPLKIQELQNYCQDNREELRAIAFRSKQSGLNAETLT